MKQILLLLCLGLINLTTTTWGEKIYEGFGFARIGPGGKIEVKLAKVNEITETPDVVGTREKREVRTTWSITADDIVEFLESHHYYRKIQGSSNMNYLYWNDTLADYAQEFGDMCIWGHDQPDRSDAAWTNDFIGQNLYFRSKDYEISYAHKRWHDEIVDYDYDTQTCTGPICGHYTQITWAYSEWVGCSKVYCADLIDMDTGLGYGKAYYTLCNYGPGGNVPGVDPFKKGENCTGCESNIFWCWDGLCRDCAKDGVTDECECADGCVHGTPDPTTCTCTTCDDGWTGETCNTRCEDINENCGNVRGWKVGACTGRNAEQIQYYCPAMCGLCVETDIPTTTTERTETTSQADPVVSTAAPTAPPTTSDPPTTSEPDAPSTTEPDATSTTSASGADPETSSTDRSMTSSSTPGNGNPQGDTTSASTATSTSEQEVTGTTPTGEDETSSSEPEVTSSTAPREEVTSSAEVTSGGSSRASTVFSSTTPRSSSTPSTTTTTTTTPVPITAPQESACAGVTCYNGATLQENPCQCLCPSGYQGVDCSQNTEEAESGVEIQLAAQLEQWTDIEPVILETFASAVNDICKQEEYFGECCPGSSALAMAAQKTYIDINNVETGQGYPVMDSETLFALMYVKLPEDSEFCGDSSRRRKRSLSEITLPQDVLYDAIVSSQANLTQALSDCCNIAVKAVEKGQNKTGWVYVIQEANSQTGMADWLIAVIVICCLIPVVAVLVIVAFIMLKEKPKGSKVAIIEEEKKNPFQLSRQMTFQETKEVVDICANDIEAEKRAKNKAPVLRRFTTVSNHVQGGFDEDEKYGMSTVKE